MQQISQHETAATDQIFTLVIGPVSFNPLNTRNFYIDVDWLHTTSFRDFIQIRTPRAVRMTAIRRGAVAEIIGTVRAMIQNRRAKRRTTIEMVKRSQ